MSQSRLRLAAHWLGIKAFQIVILAFVAWFAFNVLNIITVLIAGFPLQWR